MKNKIIFMVINMNIGGTEKALLSMIDEIDKAGWDVTILMLEKFGGFLDEIPAWVNVKYVDEYSEVKPYVSNPPIVMIKKLMKEREYAKALAMTYHYGISKISNNSLYLNKYILRNVEVLNEEYDVAVAYAGPMDFITYFVHEKISAKRKVQWIHFDVTKVGFNEKLVKTLYPKFDKAFVVSEEGRRKLINKFPELKNSTEVFHNIVSKKKIIELANKGVSYEDNFHGIRILTVGRLSKEKGQDLIIPALANLKAEGYKVRWYCIGEGNYRKECEELIKEYKVEKDFILLGSKKNPYPYMKDCDIYVQPSRHEGYCITLAEAKCFNNQIVATDFTGAREQIQHKKTGLVCKVTKESIYESVKRLLDDKELFKYITANVEALEINNYSDIAKLMELTNK
ncbi:MAG: glycosyltransferase [Clostridium sp.]|uniref:glycosyltransferase n=1 Tax=Clostridium sp. TaxID=1506 RepID=UPI00305C5974